MLISAASSEGIIITVLSIYTASDSLGSVLYVDERVLSHLLLDVIIDPKPTMNCVQL